MWKKLSHNEVLQGEGFYISYNPKVGGKINKALGGFAAILSGDTEYMEEREETALYDEANNGWYILNGDFRKQYEEAYPQGLTACIAVYEKYKGDYRSKWSSD